MWGFSGWWGALRAWRGVYLLSTLISSALHGRVSKNRMSPLQFAVYLCVCTCSSGGELMRGIGMPLFIVLICMTRSPDPSLDESICGGYEHVYRPEDQLGGIPLISS